MLHRKSKPVETDSRAVEWYTDLARVFSVPERAQPEAANSPEPVKQDDHLRDYMG